MQNERHTVLVVDDNRLMRTMLGDALGGRMDVLTAGDGAEALDVLAQQNVDLVLTDLHMPRLDGFELIATLVRERPLLPVVVMTALPTAVAGGALSGGGILRVLRKPLELSTVADYLLGVLDERASGRLTGVSLASLLQILQLERKTCTLQVRAPAGTATLYLDQGELIEAALNGRHGYEAALEIIPFDRPTIELVGGCRAERTIHEPLNQLLLEAMRNRDEAARLLTSRPSIVPFENPITEEHIISRGVDAWAEWPGDAPEHRDDAPLPLVPGLGTQPVAPALPPAIPEALARAVRMAGALGAAVFDTETGTRVRDLLAPTADATPERVHTAMGLTDLLRGALRITASWGTEQPDEIVVAAGETFHVVRPIPSMPTLCVHLVLRRRPESLVMARNVLARLDTELQQKARGGKAADARDPLATKK